MFKFVILFAIIAAASANPVATPLIAKLSPQPALAPANTEHAGYVRGLIPVARQIILQQPVYAGLSPINGGHISFTGVQEYVAISPIEASL